MVGILEREKKFSEKRDKFGSAFSTNIVRGIKEFCAAYKDS
jgi:hypothetical protein